MSDEYRNLMVTDEFWASLGSLDPPLSAQDVDGIMAALDRLDGNPTGASNRLHRLDRELDGWWSLTPPSPASPALRILVRPEKTGLGGVWRLGPATWHYLR